MVIINIAKFYWIIIVFIFFRKYQEIWIRYFKKKKKLN